AAFNGHQHRKKDMKKLIIFVCNGNMHRSPIAERITQKLLSERGLEGTYEVVSRGIQGTVGTKPTKHRKPIEYDLEWNASLPTLQKLGIELADHVSIPITKNLVERASVIVAMAHDVLTREPNGLNLQFPEYRRKARLFTELAGKEEDVPDCGGVGDTEVHRATIELISEVLHEHFDELIAWINEECVR
ncbi:MAG: hypothetical protein AAB967_03245, partial [Patescibacteria group bacterium]